MFASCGCNASGLLYDALLLVQYFGSQRCSLLIYIGDCILLHFPVVWIAGSHLILLFGRMQVVLQVNVGVDFLHDPVIEVLQFEKYQDINLNLESQDNSVSANPDPCGSLLKWLLPLDNTLPPSRPLSPPLSSSSGIGISSQKPTFSSTSSSQLFSFSNFRSYSMSSLPQSTVPSPAPIKAASSKPSFDLEDWDQLSAQKPAKSQKPESEELLSFRGVALDRERFSVRCGLEGIYIPGRRWRRKLEIIQPVEIHSFAADCNTDDLICVQVKVWMMSTTEWSYSANCVETISC